MKVDIDNTVPHYGIVGELREQVDLTINFGGRQGEIGAYTLLKSLRGITDAIAEINNEIGKGQTLDIQIKALKGGSFLVYIGLVPVKIADLFQYADLGTVKDIVTTLVGVLTLRKFLSGRKPKTIQEAGNSVHIQNEAGGSTTVNKTVYNIYADNVRVNEAISRHFESIDADPQIESFALQDGKRETLFEATKGEFESLSSRAITTLPDENARVVHDTATVLIYKIVFDKSRKWEFLHRGEKFSAKIVDESFFQRINDGQQFRKGDSLEIEFDTRQVLDKAVGAYINESHTVTRVIRHIPRPSQDALDLMD